METPAEVPGMLRHGLVFAAAKKIIPSSNYGMDSLTPGAAIDNLGDTVA